MGFSIDIFNVAYTSGDQTLYFEDINMNSNHILSLENLVDYKDDDPYDYRVRDLKSAVNKNTLMKNFLKKTQMIIILILGVIS